MQKGMTYIVRPCMQPLYRPFIVTLSSLGSIQWLVGPASSSLTDEMNVRDSTRATSEGSERKRKLFSFFLSGVARPFFTHSCIRRSYSSFEPSTTTTLSGSHILTHSSTQALIFGCLMSLSVKLIQQLLYNRRKQRNSGFYNVTHCFQSPFLCRGKGVFLPYSKI